MGGGVEETMITEKLERKKVNAVSHQRFLPAPQPCSRLYLLFYDVVCPAVGFN